MCASSSPVLTTSWICFRSSLVVAYCLLGVSYYAVLLV